MGEVAQGGGSFAAQSLRMQVALAPLLSGRIDARELVLRSRSCVAMAGAAELVRRPPGGLSDGFNGPGRGWLGRAGRPRGRRHQRIAPDERCDRDFRGGDDDDRRTALAVRTRLGGQDGKGRPRSTWRSKAGKSCGRGTKLSGSSRGRDVRGRSTARGLDLSRSCRPRLPFQAEGRLTAAGVRGAKDLSLELGGSPARGP